MACMFPRYALLMAPWLVWVVRVEVVVVVVSGALPSKEVRGVWEGVVAAEVVLFFLEVEALFILKRGIFIIRVFGLEGVKENRLFFFFGRRLL